MGLAPAVLLGSTLPRPLCPGGARAGPLCGQRRETTGAEGGGRGGSLRVSWLLSSFPRALFFLRISVQLPYCTAAPVRAAPVFQKHRAAPHAPSSPGSIAGVMQRVLRAGATRARAPEPQQRCPSPGLPEGQGLGFTAGMRAGGGPGAAFARLLLPVFIRQSQDRDNLVFAALQQSDPANHQGISLACARSSNVRGLLAVPAASSGREGFAFPGEKELKARGAGGKGRRCRAASPRPGSRFPTGEERGELASSGPLEINLSQVPTFLLFRANGCI